MTHAPRNVVTIDTIAKRCGVVKSTVSSVLNNRRSQFSVLPEKRELILRTARELNYQPNVAARTLKSKQTKIVLILGYAEHTAATIYPQLVFQASEQFRQAGYHACAGFPHPEHSSAAMLPWKVDGAILLPSQFPEDLQEVENAGIPYVTVNRPAGPNGIALLLDEHTGMLQAMKHLFSLGHTRIVYRNSPKDSKHYSISQRHDAFLEACREQKAPILPGHDLYAIGAEAFWKEIVLPNRATAVVVYSNGEAMDLLFTAQRLGIRIPGQVSLMCFNDVDPCSRTVPSLTAVAQPVAQMGITAGRLLLRMMSGRRPAGEPVRWFQEEVVPRESTTPPANA